MTEGSAVMPSSPDERVQSLAWPQRLLGRPEAASVSGTVAVFLVFGLVAGGSGMFSAEGIVNWATVAAFIGILATGAALLMIGGEFDLSIGSMIGFAGMGLAIPTLYWGWPPWLAPARLPTWPAGVCGARGRQGVHRWSGCCRSPTSGSRCISCCAPWQQRDGWPPR